MKIVRTTILPFKGFTAINLLGVLFVHPGVYLSHEMMNHERIHSAQQREMLFVFFYLAYLMEWLLRLPMRGISGDASPLRVASLHETPSPSSLPTP